MSELHATIAVIFMLGILLALARLIQIAEKKRKSETLFSEHATPLMAQLEQTMHMLAATMPQATDAMHSLADAMQKVGYTMEEMTRDEDLNEQQQHLKGSIRINLIKTTDP